MESDVSAADRVASAVTALFVPGDRPERFIKAADSGADVVVYDWEDGVAAPNCAAAIASVERAIRDDGFRALIRIVGAADPAHSSQRAAAVALSHQGGLGIMVAKAEDVNTIRSIRAELPDDCALVPLIESAVGLHAAPDLANYATRLAFGALDFGVDIGSSSHGSLSYAAAALVIASRVGRCAPPLQSPDPEFRDLAAVEARAELARLAGFGGQLCIHPAQVDRVFTAFQPSSKELDWARSVVNAADGVTAVNGAMVDKPVIERARRLLRQTVQ